MSCFQSSRILRESSPVETGFRLEYIFHTDWNMASMLAKVDKNKPCRFVFNSSIQSSGKLWSINHPGLYPRNLYCEYIFHGFEDQIVHIHFEYFDVEGFNQCDETTQSDYVLFSNYQTHDRTNRRFCGKVSRWKIWALIFRWPLVVLSYQNQIIFEWSSSPTKFSMLRDFLLIINLFHSVCPLPLKLNPFQKSPKSVASSWPPRRPVNRWLIYFLWSYHCCYNRK